jgi:hypothetical protein
LAGVHHPKVLLCFIDRGFAVDLAVELGFDTLYQVWEGGQIE